MRVRKLILFISIWTLTLTSCDRSLPFEKSKWENKVDGSYPFRNKMIDDLIRTTHFKEKSLREVFEILGEHDDWCDHNMYELRYQVLVDYDMDIDPVHTKFLVFELDSTKKDIDSNTVVIDVRIDEWKK